MTTIIIVSLGKTLNNNLLTHIAPFPWDIKKALHDLLEVVIIYM